MISTLVLNSLFECPWYVGDIFEV